MPWSIYIACCFSGAFLANVVPHFVQGICGNPFPTPFAKPPGKGLSSPMVNTLWALLNLLIGAILFHLGHVATATIPLLIVFFLGIAAISILCTQNFQHKQKL